MERKKKSTLELVKEHLEKEIEELPNLTFMHLDTCESPTEYMRGVRHYCNQLTARLCRHVNASVYWTINDEPEGN